MKAAESQQILPCMMRKMKALVNCVTSSTPRGVSWGQEVGLLPDWRTSWRQEACQIGEGQGRTHPCWRPGSPWLEGGRGEPWAASCSSGQLSTSSLERTRGPEGGGKSPHLFFIRHQPWALIWTLGRRGLQSPIWGLLKSSSGF